MMFPAARRADSDCGSVPGGRQLALAQANLFGLAMGHRAALLGRIRSRGLMGAVNRSGADL